jgi:hypothetical protein
MKDRTRLSGTVVLSLLQQIHDEIFTEEEIGK